MLPAMPCALHPTNAPLSAPTWQGTCFSSAWRVRAGGPLSPQPIAFRRWFATRDECLGRCGYCISPNQPRRAIHFAASSTGTIVVATATTTAQSAGARSKVPKGCCSNGT